MSENIEELFLKNKQTKTLHSTALVLSVGTPNKGYNHTAHSVFIGYLVFGLLQ